MKGCGWFFWLVGLAASVAVGAVPGCLVDPVCYSQKDCPVDQSCHSPTGSCSPEGACARDADCPAEHSCGHLFRCVPGECQTDEDCEGERICRDGLCRSLEPLVCPQDMLPVADSFCIDVWEASRPDATDRSAGSDGTMATSRPGVLPWQLPVDSNAVAQAACLATGKRLCSESEWFTACRGPQEHVYAYGDEYGPATCNGIDTYCDCDQGPCASHDPCPYPGCFHDCRADTPFHLMPTGSFAGCTSGYGVFDMNGNAWEHVLDGDDRRIRGGAFNCSDSQTLHRCDYVPGDWAPSAKGFRCCLLPEAGG